MFNDRLSRRSFLKQAGKRALGGLLVGAGAIAYTTHIEPGWIDVPEIHLTLPRLSPAFDGLRLALLSDFHVGGWMNRARLDEAVRLTLSLRPDVVALTGDYLMASYNTTGRRINYAGILQQLEEGLRPLAERSRVVAVLGNHDHRAGGRLVRSMLENAGVRELRNAVYPFTRGSETLHLCGVDDYYERRDRLPQVLAQLPEDGAAILLVHEPDFADISARTGRFDLQLSGHSHGGQVVLPFLRPPVLPRYGRKYPSGLYQVGSMFQYTNRGLGMGRLGVRFNCRPEITLFVLSAPLGGPEDALG